MISIEVLIAGSPGLHRPDLQRWIDNDWVRPGRDAGGYVFVDIDVARVRLIRDLRDGLHIDEETLPVVLSLLDQLHDLRRRMRELGAAIERVAPEEVQEALALHLVRGRAG